MDHLQSVESRFQAAIAGKILVGCTPDAPDGASWKQNTGPLSNDINPLHFTCRHCGKTTSLRIPISSGLHEPGCAHPFVSSDDSWLPQTGPGK